MERINMHNMHLFEFSPLHVIRNSTAYNYSHLDHQCGIIVHSSQFGLRYPQPGDYAIGLGRLGSMVHTVRSVPNIDSNMTVTRRMANDACISSVST